MAGRGRIPGPCGSWLRLWALIPLNSSRGPEGGEEGKRRGLDLPAHRPGPWACQAQDPHPGPRTQLLPREARRGPEQRHGAQDARRATEGARSSDLRWPGRLRRRTAVGLWDSRTVPSRPLEECTWRGSWKRWSGWALYIDPAVSCSRAPCGPPKRPSSKVRKRVAARLLHKGPGAYPGPSLIPSLLPAKRYFFDMGLP